ncbi:hypothetical protein PHYPO_G00169110 [Pangasianodon hypophthalmus]|uniref:Uncharacterized protein n=1 Tax=Pangasianodon hypophthalmus TaxID=310915 RepID=A0A5N5JEF0_PANHP|nr:hypothetical protein PHYPO_G00169110 [Pangasianodon hypophthalmus]
MNGGFQKKPLKEEEPEDEEYICNKSGGTSISVVHVTPVEQQNGGFQKKLIKEEEPDEDYLYCEQGMQNVVIQWKKKSFLSSLK